MTGTPQPAARNDERQRTEAAARADGSSRGNASGAVDAYTAAQDAQDAAAAHSSRTFRIWRGARGTGEFKEYRQDVVEGMVVLDAVHEIQATQANDLAVRWNCKAGKCGSCSAEVNGMPKLMCMTRLDQLPADEPVTIEPMKAFPHVRDLVTDVSWNFEVKKKIQKFTPRPPDAPDGTWRMQQDDIDRVQEFRKCIECFLCQDVCHVLRDHHKHEEFIGPRFLGRRSRCTRSTPPTASPSSSGSTASATATSRSAARGSARSTSPSPTMLSFR
jgi:succinate dehydrogenase/fumarate reductase iron-sulfur protein